MNRDHDGDYFFAFDVETVPDVEAGRRLYGLEGLDDPGTVKAMHQLRMQESGRGFLRLYLHRGGRRVSETWDHVWHPDHVRQ